MNILLSIVNYLSFYLIWFFALWAATTSHSEILLLTVAGYLGLHLCCVSSRPGFEAAVIVVVAIIGTMIDSILLMTKTVTYEDSFSSTVAPLWIISLWLSFASTYWHAFRWMNGRYLLGAISAILAAPILYIWCYKAGAVSIWLYPESYLSFFLICPLWGLFFPLTLWASSTILKLSEKSE